MTDQNKQKAPIPKIATRFDISEYLVTEQHIISYIISIVEENDWELLSRAIGHAAKSIVMSKLATELNLDRTDLYNPRSPKSIPVDALLHALLPESFPESPARRPRITKINSYDNYSIELQYDDCVKGKYDMVPYLNMSAFKELNELAYFHRVQNHGYFIAWPDGQDLCADSIYHSMIHLNPDEATRSVDTELAEIQGNITLNESMDRGIKDAKAGRGRILFSPETDLHFDEEELEVLESYHLEDIVNEETNTSYPRTPPHSA